MTLTRFLVPLFAASTLAAPVPNGVLSTLLNPAGTVATSPYGAVSNGQYGAVPDTSASQHYNAAAGLFNVGDNFLKSKFGLPVTADPQLARLSNLYGATAMNPYGSSTQMYPGSSPFNAGYGSSPYGSSSDMAMDPSMSNPLGGTGGGLGTNGLSSSGSDFGSSGLGGGSGGGYGGGY